MYGTTINQIKIKVNKILNGVNEVDVEKFTFVGRSSSTDTSNKDQQASFQPEEMKEQFRVSKPRLVERPSLHVLPRHSHQLRAVPVDDGTKGKSVPEARAHVRHLDPRVSHHLYTGPFLQRSGRHGSGSRHPPLPLLDTIVPLLRPLQPPRECIATLRAPSGHHRDCIAPL
eukprot:g35848.t1